MSNFLTTLLKNNKFNAFEVKFKKLDDEACLFFWPNYPEEIQDKLEKYIAEHNIKYEFYHFAGIDTIHSIAIYFTDETQYNNFMEFFNYIPFSEKLTK